MRPPVPEGTAYCGDSQMGGRQVTLRNKPMKQVSECMEHKESQMFQYERIFLQLRKEIRAERT